MIYAMYGEQGIYIPKLTSKRSVCTTGHQWDDPTRRTVKYILGGGVKPGTVCAFHRRTYQSLFPPIAKGYI